MTVELLGVTVDVEAAAALSVTPEESPVDVNVARDIGILLKFVAELFIPPFDTIMTVEEKVVPSVDLRGVLFGRVLISGFFVTFSLALAAAGAAWLLVEGFMAVVNVRMSPCGAGCTVD